MFDMGNPNRNNLAFAENSPLGGATLSAAIKPFLSWGL